MKLLFFFSFSFHIVRNFHLKNYFEKSEKNRRNFFWGTFKLSCTPVMTFFFESARATSTSLSRQTKKHWLKIRNAACFPASLSAAKSKKEKKYYNSTPWNKQTHMWRIKCRKKWQLREMYRRETLKH